MRFAIMVNGSPYQNEACDTAYQFARACLDSGHEIMRVFFYHDGVYAGNALRVAPQDDRDVVDRWQSLAREAGVELVLCVAAAERRGMVDEAEQTRHRLPAANLAGGFVISGLGQLIEMAIEADRFVQFG
jgi:tRNA 2-thiouridine synthesizing protein D